MKLVVDINDNKADFFMELMKNLDFIKGVELNKTGKSNGVKKIANALGGEESSMLIMKKKEEWEQRSPSEKKAKFKAFQDLLLSGPVMDDEQYREYKQLRNRLNLWRQK